MVQVVAGQDGLGRAPPVLQRSQLGFHDRPAEDEVLAQPGLVAGRDLIDIVVEHHGLLDAFASVR